MTSSVKRWEQMSVSLHDYLYDKLEPKFVHNSKNRQPTQRSSQIPLS